MAIKKFSNYEGTKSYGDFEALPKGGYVCKVIAAKVEENTNGQYVKLAIDIAEGQYADYFKKSFDASTKEDKKWPCNYLLNVPNDDGSERDNWTARKFKTVIASFESSNEGFHFDWDEKKFKGKKIGGLFNIRQYKKNDGSIGNSVNCAQLCSVEKITSGKYKLPDDKLIAGATIPAQVKDENGFIDVASDIDEEIPF